MGRIKRKKLSSLALRRLNKHKRAMQLQAKRNAQISTNSGDNELRKLISKSDTCAAYPEEVKQVSSTSNKNNLESSYLQAKRNAQISTNNSGDIELRKLICKSDTCAAYPEEVAQVGSTSNKNNLESSYELKSGDEYSFKSRTRRVYQKRSAAKFDVSDFEGTDANNESTSENDTIHVFCPKCNTKVPHTAEGIQQDQTKILIAKVYHYFEQEYEELKKMYGNVDLSPLSEFRQRTMLATGVSDSMLQQILEEERQREVDSARRPRAHKRRRHEDSSSDENTSDDSDGDAEADNDVPQPEQTYAETETLVVKIEQPAEVNNEEPEMFVPVTLKTEPVDYDSNNEQVQTDPISVEVKTELQDDEMETTIETRELIQPATSKHKELIGKIKSEDTSTQHRTQGESSTASTSRNILTEALEQSNLWDETEFKAEGIDIHEEGFS